MPTHIHIRTSEFTEEDYISAFEGMLGRASWRPGLTISRISQVAERELGYDGLLTSCVPLYIQFKRSSFCMPSYSGQTKKDRDSLGLPTQHGYFRFNLHKDKNSGAFDQHNALWRLSQYFRAVYVAPLFYKRTQLDQLKLYSDRYPWRYEEIELMERGKSYSFRSRWFHNSVTIAPHREVTDTGPSHSYSFDQRRTLCFHSDPEPLFEGVSDSFEFFDRAYQDTKPFEEIGAIATTLMKVLPTLYAKSNQKEGFDSAIISCLEELDLPPMEPVRNVNEYISEVLSPSQMFLVAEFMLKRDFDIIQIFTQK